MTWQPKAGEYARTRDGRKAWVSADIQDPFGRVTVPYSLHGFIDGCPGWYSWLQTGQCSCGSPDNDLVGPWVEPVDVPVTVRLYSNGIVEVGHGHRPLDIADVVGYKHATIRIQPGDRG